MNWRAKLKKRKTEDAEFIVRIYGRNTWLSQKLYIMLLTNVIKIS